jgi:hypothetical protein
VQLTIGVTDSAVKYCDVTVKNKAAIKQGVQGKALKMSYEI